MKNPDISVCIPTYNGEQFLSNAIESALKQKFSGSFEILIVDDGSVDKSFLIAKQYQETHKEIVRCTRNNQNKGLVANWNECIKEARGTWIKFIFQDDWMADNCLQRMYDFGINNNLSFVLCDREYFFEHYSAKKDFYNQRLRRLSYYFLQPSIILPSELAKICEENYLEDNFMGEPIAGLFKKNLVEKFGYFNKDLFQICDLEYWLRLGLNEPFGFLPEKLVYFRIHMHSTSQANSKGLASVNDRIILGYLLIKSEYYSLFRRQFPEKVMLERRYMDILKKYIHKYGYFRLNKNRLNRNEYFKSLHPGIIQYIKSKLKTCLYYIKRFMPL